MIRLGLLSNAHMHADSYVAELRHVAGAELVGVWDDTAEKTAAMSQRYGAPGFAGLDALLESVDGVIVCSENIRHRALTEAAAAAGKPILCEKPLATTPDDAKAMVDAARSAGVALLTAFPCRFSLAYKQLKAQVAAGEIGDILAVRGTNQGMCPGGWFVQKALSGGGAVMDHTVHVTDLLRDLLGDEASEVYCESDNRLLHQDFDDTGVLTITFDRGVFASLDASWSRPKSFPTWGNVTMFVVGTRGTFEMDMFAQESVLYSDKTNRVSYQNWGSSIDKGLVAAFVRTLREGEIPAEAATGVDGLRAVEVVEAAYESVRTAQTAAVRRRSVG